MILFHLVDPNLPGCEAHRSDQDSDHDVHGDDHGDDQDQKDDDDDIHLVDSHLPES